jgi:hypothetical protein
MTCLRASRLALRSLSEVAFSDPARSMRLCSWRRNKNVWVSVRASIIGRKSKEKERRTRVEVRVALPAAPLPLLLGFRARPGASASILQEGGSAPNAGFSRLSMTSLPKCQAPRIAKRSCQQYAVDRSGTLTEAATPEDAVRSRTSLVPLRRPCTSGRLPSRKDLSNVSRVGHDLFSDGMQGDVAC